MKTKKELNALKEQIIALNEKLKELTEEEMEQVSGGGGNLVYCNMCNQMVPNVHDCAGIISTLR